MTSLSLKPFLSIFRISVWIVVVGMSTNACDCLGGGARGLAPDLVVSSDTVVMDQTYFGVETSRAVRIENRGDLATTVAIAVSGDGYSVDAVQLNVAPQSEAIVTVRLFPLSDGAIDGALTLRGERLRFEGEAAREGEGEGEAAREGEREVTLALSGTVSAIPDCDDANECTDDAFDVESESCVTVEHGRACGVDNACIQDGQCGNGRCLGTPTVCAATAPCRIAFCDPATGCAEEEVDGACDDDDPCTTDFCGESGCEHAVAPDYTTCGPTVQCQTASICQQGACTTIEIPDGVQCDDGNSCTAATCANGACIAEDVEFTPPEVLSTTFSFGGKDSSVIARPNDRLLVLDIPQSVGPQNRGWLTELSAGPSSELVVAPRQDFDNPGGALSHLVGSAASQWFGVARTFGSITHVARRQGDGFEFKQFSDNPDALVFRGDVAYVCSTGRLRVVDLLGPEPLVATAANPDDEDLLGCGSLALDNTTATLIVQANNDTSAQLQFFDLPSPLSPTFRTVFPLSSPGLLAAGGGVAVLTQVVPSSVLVFPIFDPHQPDRILIDDGALPGRPAIINGEVYLRWTLFDGSQDAELFRHSIFEFGGEWNRVDGAQSRTITSGAMVFGAGHIALPPVNEADMLLFRFFAGANTTRFTTPAVAHGRHGVLVPLPDGFASISPSRVTHVAQSLNGGELQLRHISVLPRTNEPTMLVATDIAPALISPQWRTQQYPFSPAVLGSPPLLLDLGEHVTVGRVDALVADLDGPTHPAQAGINTRVVAATTGDMLVVAYAGWDDASPTIVRTYALSTLPQSQSEAAGPWPVLGEVSLPPSSVTQQFLTSLQVAADGDRVAVYVQGEAPVLFVVDISQPAFPFVAAERVVVSEPTEVCFVGLHMHDDTILGTCTFQGVLYRLAPGSGNIVKEREAQRPFERVLAFDGDIAVVAGAQALEYVSMEPGFPVVASVPLDEQPIDFATANDRVYVTTDHTISVMTPYCEGP